MPLRRDIESLGKGAPHIVVGTPGRILDLIRNKALKLDNIKHFIIDECDKMLDTLGLSRLSDSNSPDLCRYAPRCPGYFPPDTSFQTSHDVQRHYEQRYTTSVSQFHARCTLREKST